MMAGGIYGLSGSGMDIDELVKGMMSTQQSKYDKLYKQKTVQEWKKEKYNELYKSLYAFRYNTLTDFKMQGSMSAKKATSTNESAVTAKALGDAAQMAHDISIRQLASSAYLQSKNPITRGSGVDGSIKLSDVAGVSNFDLNHGGDEIALAFSVDDGVNGKQVVSYTYDDLKNGKTLNDLASDINKLGTNIQASYDNNNDSFSMVNKVGGETNKISLSLETSFTVTDVNGKQNVLDVSDDSVKRSAKFLNNLQMASYNSADKTMGNVIQFDDTSNYAVGVSGKRAGFDVAGHDATLKDILGINLTVSGDTWSVDGTEVEKTDTAFKLKVNGQEVSFTYEDINEPLTNMSGRLSAKFGAAGVDLTFNATNTADGSGADQTSIFLQMSRPDGQGITLEAEAGPGQDFLDLLNSNMQADKLKATNSDLADSTKKIADFAGNPTIPTDQNGSDSAFVLVVNGTEIGFTYDEIQNQDMNYFADKINDAGCGATALFNGNTGELSIYSTDSHGNADGGEVSISSAQMASGSTAGTDFLNSLGFSVNGVEGVQTVVDVGTATHSEQGQSAIAVIDGREYKSDTNSITAGGVVYTANQVTATKQLDASGQPVVDSEGNPVYVDNYEKITVNSDDDTIVDNVKKFVEEYNKLLDQLNTEIYASYDKNYLPLTDDEKSKMSESQIEKWEKKAMTGLLYKDSILKDVVSQMRSALSSVLSGTGNDYNSLSSIGITTTDYTEHGKIELDEDKLRKALNKDPDSVYKLFATLTDNDNEKGVIHRLSSAVDAGIKKIKSEAGDTADADDQSYVGQKISRLSTQMSTLLSRMQQQESSLYKKFNAMETAISQLNQQYGFLTSAFGSGS